MDRKKNLETSLVIVTGLVIIYLFRHWDALLMAAGIIGFIGVFLDKPASWITWFWYKLADLLGKIIPKILLAVVFYVFLFPIALLSRITGRKNPAKRSLNDSQWIKRDYCYTEKDLAKMW